LPSLPEVFFYFVKIKLPQNSTYTVATLRVPRTTIKSPRKIDSGSG